MTLSPEKTTKQWNNCCAGALTCLKTTIWNVFLPPRNSKNRNFRGGTINLDSVQCQKLRPPLVPENLWCRFPWRTASSFSTKGTISSCLIVACGTFSWNWHLVLCTWIFVFATARQKKVLDWKESLCDYITLEEKSKLMGQITSQQCSWLSCRTEIQHMI